MGNFQAVAAGLGEGGEQLGTGLNNALNEALKVRAQLHTESTDNAHIALAQALQKQQYDLAQQQHELMRQTILSNGWTHTGTILDPNDNKYYQVFNNPRMPAGQQTSKIPYDGVPPDSPQALVNQVNFYKGQTDENGKRLFTDRQITEKVFNLHDLYRQDPAGVVQGFRQDAQDQADNGVSKVKVPGFGTMDISNDQGRANYAQAMADSYWGKGSFLRAAMGLGPGQKDMTGWTAGEKREFDALRLPAERQVAAITKLAEIQLSSTSAAFDPEQQKVIKQQMLEQIEGIMKPVDDRAAEISNRHHGPISFQVPAGAPPATNQPDGATLKDNKGNVIGKAKGGKWVPPNTP